MVSPNMIYSSHHYIIFNNNLHMYVLILIKLLIYLMFGNCYLTALQFHNGKLLHPGQSVFVLPPPLLLLAVLPLV